MHVLPMKHVQANRAEVTSLHLDITNMQLLSNEKSTKDENKVNETQHR